MATTFLRKIILEELKKVLKEQSGGTSKEGPYSTVFGGPPGPEQKSFKRQSPYFPEKKPTSSGGSSAVKKLQKTLIKFGFLDKGSDDSIPGSMTFNGARAAGVVEPGMTIKQFKSLSSSAVDAMTEKMLKANPKDLYSRAAKYQVGGDQVLKTLALKPLSSSEDSKMTATTVDTTSKSDSSTDYYDSGLPKLSNSEAPFTDKATMDKRIGPRTMFKHDPEAVRDTGPKKGEEDVKVKLGEPDLEQEALVRAISKLLKTL